MASLRTARQNQLFKAGKLETDFTEATRPEGKCTTTRPSYLLIYFLFAYLNIYDYQTMPLRWLALWSKAMNFCLFLSSPLPLFACVGRGDTIRLSDQQQAQRAILARRLSLSLDISKVYGKVKERGYLRRKYLATKIISQQQKQNTQAWSGKNTFNSASPTYFQFVHGIDAPKP